MQRINTINAMPKTTIQLATGNRVVDALMHAPQTVAKKRKPSQRVDSRDDAHDRCLERLLASIANRISTASWLTGHSGFSWLNSPQSNGKTVGCICWLTQNGLQQVMQMAVQMTRPAGYQRPVDPTVFPLFSTSI